jgi:hypothetical protein
MQDAGHSHMRGTPTPTFTFNFQLSNLSTFKFWLRRGRQKHKTPPGDPRGVWVGQRPKNGLGSDFYYFFLIAFLSPKNVIKNLKNREKAGFGFLVEFLQKIRHDFFVKRFCSVFKLPSLKNTRKRDKTKKSREN